MKAKIKPKTFDDYFNALNVDQRAALEKMRQAIHAAAPGAEEYISYGLAAFRHNGRPLVALGAWKEHCALYPMSSTIIANFQDVLAKYETSKGTIRFPTNKPLPATLVKKIVKARIAEIQG